MNDILSRPIMFAFHFIIQCCYRITLADIKCSSAKWHRLVLKIMWPVWNLVLYILVLCHLPDHHHSMQQLPIPLPQFPATYPRTCLLHHRVISNTSSTSPWQCHGIPALPHSTSLDFSPMCWLLWESCVFAPTTEVLNQQNIDFVFQACLISNSEDAISSKTFLYHHKCNICTSTYV